MEPQGDLASTLSAMARDMAGVGGPHNTIEVGVKTILDHIDGAEQVGISLIEGKNVSTVAPSSDVVRRGDELQSAIGDNAPACCSWLEWRSRAATLGWGESASDRCILADQGRLGSGRPRRPALPS